MRILQSLLVFAIFLAPTTVSAQKNVDLSRMEPKSCKEYLVQLAKEGGRLFFPASYSRCDFQREPFVEKRSTKEGRSFYTIVFYPKSVGGKTHFTYYIQDKDGKWVARDRRLTAIAMDVWENTGQPKSVEDDDNNCISFDEKGEYSYREWIKKQAEK